MEFDLTMFSCHMPYNSPTKLICSMSLRTRKFMAHTRKLAATSSGFMHTSDHCDPYTSKSGSVMQARHAKVSNFHDHAAIHRYRQAILNKLASSKHTIAHKLGGHRSKFTTHVSDDHRLGDNSDVVQHISYDSSISDVATSDKDDSKSDDETRHYNSNTNLHCC